MIDEKKLIEDLIPMLNENDDMFLAGRIIGTIDRQPQVGGWIPVSERLPENYKEVLVQWEKTNRAENIITVYLSIGLINEDGEWCSPDGFGIFNEKVVAWQPLPEPFKESDKE